MGVGNASGSDNAEANFTWHEYFLPLRMRREIRFPRAHQSRRMHTKAHDDRIDD